MFVTSQHQRWKGFMAGYYNWPLYAYFFHLLVPLMYMMTVMTAHAPGISFLPHHLERNQEGCRERRVFYFQTCLFQKQLNQKYTEQARLYIS